MRLSIEELGEFLRTRQTSSVELTEGCLARIERFNPKLNAFITVSADSALAEARQADSEILRGNWRGPLHGIPLAVKDLIDLAGVPTTAASAVFKNRTPTRNAEIISRLKVSGAVLLGKQNLHEFAYGGSGIISDYGEVRNPWNVAHIAGGSSGGSAASVAASLCYGSVGTDTAGSIRLPASFCGVVGLKPTYGRVSVEGVIPLSTSLDHVGPIAATVADSAILFDALIGEPQSTQSYYSQLRIKKTPLRIGVPRNFFFEDLDPEVEAAVEAALRMLESPGNSVREVETQILDYRELQAGEAYEFHRQFVAKTPDLYHPETLRRILRGRDMTPGEILAQREELQKTRRDILKIFEQVDVLVTPTTPAPAPSIAELQKDMENLRPTEIFMLRNTRPANVWGLPAISLPCGFTRTGLPIGLQIIGPPWLEEKVFQFAYQYEQATGWIQRHPDLLTT